MVLWRRHTLHFLLDLQRTQIACRCSEKLEKTTTDKIAHWCQVELEQVIAVHDVQSTYHVPLLLEHQGLVLSLREILHLDSLPISLKQISRGEHTWHEWRSLTTAQDRLFDSVTIALVGKYTNLHDSYLSVIKSLEHAAMHCRRKLHLTWIDAAHLEAETEAHDAHKYHTAWCHIHEADGVLVPGGFGARGTEGMVAAARQARESNKPFLGVCLGMQLAVVEFARNVCGVPDATSGEFEPEAASKLIVDMPELDSTKKGATMRLGLRATLFQPGSEWSRMRALYGATLGQGHPRERDGKIWERHRHRYEVNPDWIARLEQCGMAFVGKDESGRRMEVVELRDHRWFVGVQFHPEYLSRVLAPSKPYLGLVAASAGCLDEVMAELRVSSGDRGPDRARRASQLNGLSVNHEEVNGVAAKFEGHR